MEGAYETLHYLRRIEVAATQMRDHLKIILIPYEIHSYGHTLAAGRLNSKEGVFFDGVFIDTKLSFNTPEVKPDSHLSR